MSFREKHLWITVFSTVIVWAVYFRELIDRVLNGGLMDDRFAVAMGIAFAGALFVVAVVEVALTVIATLTTPKAERGTRDEREIHAALKASHVSLMLLIVLVVTLSGTAYFMGLTSPAFGTHVAMTGMNAFVLLANVLIACVIVSELVRAGLTLVLLRGLR